MHYYGDINNYLAHHGILGMRWGQRNGPPYPLGYENHSSAEKKAGWEDSLKKKSSDDTVYSGDRKLAKDMKSQGKSDEEILKTLRENNKSDKTEAMNRMAINIALGIATMNPFRIAAAVEDVAKAGYAGVKEKKSEDRRSTLKTDPSTGLHLKDRDWDPDEDCKAVNPAVYNFDANTKNNCVLCSATYDLRRRGYDVTANKTTVGYLDTVWKEFYPKSKVEYVYMPTKGSKEERSSYMRARFGLNKELARTTLDTIKQQGDGARGTILVKFDSPQSGHSTAYEVENGEVVIRDCQIGKTFKGNKAEDYLKHCGSARYVRLDNVDFDKKKIKEAAS